jgi:hypothetical protein
VFDAITGDKVFRRVRNVADLSERLVTAYPGVNVLQEIRKAALWCVAKKRAVKSGTFLTTWMGNADPAPAGGPLASGVFDLPLAAADDDRAAFNAQIERQRAALAAEPMLPEVLRRIEGAR